MNPWSFFGALIRFALLVGMAGGLVDLTRGMMGKAYRADRVGVVDLVPLTRQLMGPAGSRIKSGLHER